MTGGDKSERKQNYFAKLKKCLTEYTKCFIVVVDNVTSLQLAQIRKALRGRAAVLMGKNTMIRKGLRELIDELPQLEKLLAQFKGNVGFVFTNGDLNEIREAILSNKVQAPARAGALAPLDVFVPPGNTGMGPDKTSFFQALAIQTKITKGMVEIINEVHLIKKDEKVGASEATLLQMLKIYPFNYGLKVIKVFDNGALYDPSVLDVTMDDVSKMVVEGLLCVACVALAINYPTAASAPHVFINAFKDVAGLALAADYVFDRIKSVKEMLDNPELMAAATAVSAPAAGAGGDKKAAPAAAAAAAAPAEDEESDEDMGMGLFD